MNERGDGAATGQRGGGIAGQPSSRTAWISGARNWWLPGFSLVLVTALIVWRWDSAGPGILALLILPGIVATLSSVRVIAGQAGVRVGLGRWGWPAKVVDYADIASAAVEQISPASVGGWGYRVKRGTTVVMVCGGECLVLDLRNGKRLAVSCRDAGTGAAFVNRFLTRG